MGNRVLTDGAVEHQQHFVGRRGVQPGEHPFDLLQFVHQMNLGVEPARRVRDQDIDVACLGGLEAVEDHCGRFGTGLLRDDRYPIALRPHLELFARRRAKGIAGRQHHRTPLSQQPVGQLADGGGLAGAVDADHQDDIGLDPRVDDERLLDRCENVEHRPVQRFEQGVHVVQLFAGDARAQLPQDAGRRLGAAIGGDVTGYDAARDTLEAAKARVGWP